MASTYAKTRDGIRRLNTKVTRDGERFTVKLYATVVYDENAERVVLAHGGWVTPTTASRINQALHHRGFYYGVVIRKGELFLSSSTGLVPFENGQIVLHKQAIRQEAA